MEGHPHYYCQRRDGHPRFHRWQGVSYNYQGRAVNFICLKWVA
jgi:hypothetical protein